MLGIFEVVAQEVDDVEQQTNGDMFFQHRVDDFFVERKELNVGRGVCAGAVRAMVEYGHFAEGIAGSAFGDQLTVDRDVDFPVEHDENVAAELSFVEDGVSGAVVDFSAVVQNAGDFFGSESIKEFYFLCVCFVFSQVAHRDTLSDFEHIPHIASPNDLYILDDRKSSVKRNLANSARFLAKV